MVKTKELFESDYVSVGLVKNRDPSQRKFVIVGQGGIFPRVYGMEKKEKLEIPIQFVGEEKVLTWVVNVESWNYWNEAVGDDTVEWIGCVGNFGVQKAKNNMEMVVGEFVKSKKSLEVSS